MSQANVFDNGDHLLIDLNITRPGKLGIEFQQTSSPYVVVRVSDEAQQLYSVIPGDHMIALKSAQDGTWIETIGLDWAGIVTVLKDRPAFARFMRHKLAMKSDRSPISVPQPILSSKSPISQPVSSAPTQRGPFDTEPEDEAATFFNEVVSSQSAPHKVQLQIVPTRGPFDTPPPDVSPKALQQIAAPHTLVPPLPVSTSPKETHVQPKVVAPLLREASSPKELVHVQPPSVGISTPKEIRVQPPELPITRNTSVPILSPKAQPQSSPSTDRITIVYSTEGPLGLEFEEVDYPYKVRSIIAGSMSQEKGVRRGDCLITVNGKSTEGMSWEQLRGELMTRPAFVEFSRHLTSGSPQAANSSTPRGGGVWSLAANLVMGGGPAAESTSSEVESLVRERDELRAIIASLNNEDLDALKYRASQTESVQMELQKALVRLETVEEQNKALRDQVEEERLKNANLLAVVDSREKSQSDLMSRFETEISQREKKIHQLELELNNLRSLSPQSVPDATQLKDQLSTYEARIELIEKDNTRLRKENTDLGVMVQQCLEKIQKDLADKPHWVDRRVVCGAVATLLRDMDNIDDGASNAIDAHATARQRLGDVLGLTFEERSTMGLLTVPEKYTRESQVAGIGEDFVTFLQKETETDTSAIKSPSPSSRNMS